MFNGCTSEANLVVQSPLSQVGEQDPSVWGSQQSPDRTGCYLDLSMHFPHHLSEKTRKALVKAPVASQSSAFLGRHVAPTHELAGNPFACSFIHGCGSNPNSRTML